MHRACKGVGSKLLLSSQVFEERAATFQSCMVKLCEHSVDGGTAASHQTAEVFLVLLRRVARAILASGPQQAHLASRGFRDWGIQTCSICDKLSNSADGSQLTLALLAFLRAPRIALLLPNDALILWKAAVQELNTLSAQSSQSYVSWTLLKLEYLCFRYICMWVSASGANICAAL